MILIRLRVEFVFVYEHKYLKICQVPQQLSYTTEASFPQVLRSYKSYLNLVYSTRLLIQSQSCWQYYSSEPIVPRCLVLQHVGNIVETFSTPPDCTSASVPIKAIHQRVDFYFNINWALLYLAMCLVSSLRSRVHSASFSRKPAGMTNTLLFWVPLSPPRTAAHKKVFLTCLWIFIRKTIYFMCNIFWPCRVAPF